jgi:hypothetical protein
MTNGSPTAGVGCGAVGVGEGAAVGVDEGVTRTVAVGEGGVAGAAAAN